RWYRCAAGSTSTSARRLRPCSGRRSRRRTPSTRRGPSRSCPRWASEPQARYSVGRPAARHAAMPPARSVARDSPRSWSAAAPRVGVPAGSPVRSGPLDGQRPQGAVDQLVPGHPGQRWGVDVEADGRDGAGVDHPVYVVRAELPGGSATVPAIHQAYADGLLGEPAREDREGAGRAAVVVQVGALTGEPGQQPGLVVVGRDEPGVPALVRIERRAQRPGRVELDEGTEAGHELITPSSVLHKTYGSSRNTA